MKKKKKIKKDKIIGTIILGLVCIFFCFILFWGNKDDNERKNRCTEKAIAKIINVEVKGDRVFNPDTKIYDDYREYIGKLKFEVNGKEYIVEHEVFEEQHAGKTIEIYYNKNNPNDIYIKDSPISVFAQFWTIITAILVIDELFVLLSFKFKKIEDKYNKNMLCFLFPLLFLIPSNIDK